MFWTSLLRMFLRDCPHLSATVQRVSTTATPVDDGREVFSPFWQKIKSFAGNCQHYQRNLPKVPIHITIDECIKNSLVLLPEVSRPPRPQSGEIVSVYPSPVLSNRVTSSCVIKFVRVRQKIQIGLFQ
jgi:hypothetical protein